MVILRYLLMSTFFLCISWGYGDEIKVSAELSERAFFPNQPITGTITIQHLKSDTIDTTSFSLDGSPLEVKLLRTVEISPQSELTLSFYNFTVPKKEAGLHVLPGINVKIGGKNYKTPAMTYEIKRVAKVTTSTKGFVLQLEPFVEGKVPLYIGQKVTVGYRIFFNANFDLSEQVLPLLDAKGFKKVGKERIEDVKQGGMSVRQIEQAIQAEKPGSFSFGPSYLTGYTYTTDWRGRKKTVGKEIRAEAAPVEILVKDFPKEGKPPSFNGSIGSNIDFSIQLEGANQVTVGDRLTLSIEFSSSNDLAGVKLPELCCQPGIPGFFELDDIPPLPVKGPNSLLFTVDLRPLTPHIKEFPPMEFSYFNPESELYETKKSAPLAITVAPSPAKPLPESSDQKEPLNKTEVTWPPTTPVPSPIEIHSIYPLTSSDLSNYLFGTWAVYLLIPFGALAIYIQVDIREKRRRKQKTEKKQDSLYWLKKAKAVTNNIPKLLHLLKKALFIKLKEEGIIENEEISIEELPVGAVKSFLTEIEEKRFTGKGVIDSSETISKTETLLKKIKKGSFQ